VAGLATGTATCSSLDETLVDGLERTCRDAIANNSRPVRGLEVVELSAVSGSHGR
jgi:hypothetical protein